MDKRISLAIRTGRNANHSPRTEVLSIRVSPEEKKIIEEKFGGMAALRDYAVGVSAKVAVDIFIDEFRDRLASEED
jgi:hypothetical protein